MGLQINMVLYNEKRRSSTLKRRRGPRLKPEHLTPVMAGVLLPVLRHRPGGQPGLRGGDGHM